jgi:hypothetical protein
MKPFNYKNQSRKESEFLYPEEEDDSSNQNQMNRETAMTADRYFGTEIAMDTRSCLVFNLSQRVYERKDFQKIIEEGLVIT